MTINERVEAKKSPLRTLALAASVAAMAGPLAASQLAAAPDSTLDAGAPADLAPSQEPAETGFGFDEAVAQWTAGAEDQLWTGPYFGLSVGYASGRSQHYYNRAGHGTAETEPSGDAYAVTAGYNLEWPSGFTAGVEADFGTMGLEDDTKVIFDDHYYNTDWGEWFVTLRARAGYAFDDMLIYGTAGVGFVDSDEVVIGNTPQEGVSNDRVMTARVFGLGVEKKLWERTSLKGEWLHFDFVEKTGVNIGPGGDPEDWRFDGRANLFRVGINVAI